MRTYYITVRSFEAAIAVDPIAQWIRTLPATVHVNSYCCREATVSPIPEAYIYSVSVKCRREAEHAPGVIKCRAKEPEQYKKTLYSRVC